MGESGLRGENVWMGGTGDLELPIPEVTGLVTIVLMGLAKVPVVVPFPVPSFPDDGESE